MTFRIIIKISLNSCHNPDMKKIIRVIFHDAGGGHRNAAIALQAIIEQKQLPWQVELVQFQELTDQLDVLRKLTGIRIQEQYNILLRKGWTLGSAQLLRVLQATIRLFHKPLVKLLEEYWRAQPADLLVSVIPHFNRQICQSWNKVYAGRPFVTLITDLADFPPHFWIEPLPKQYLIVGTERAVQQARALGRDEKHIFRTSGMILRPEFYDHVNLDPVVVREELGLRPDLLTGIVSFGGYGSEMMYDITERLDTAALPLQLVLNCGRNEKLAEKLKAAKWRMPVKIVGYTSELYKFMRASHFFIGKPGPGSITEAMVCGLPVLVACNAWTLPQERYNAQWVVDKRVGVVLKSFRDVVNGVRQIIEATKLEKLKSNVAQIQCRAIFEIPDIFANLMQHAPFETIDDRHMAPDSASQISHPLLAAR